jgi:oxygen-dependent protoporphyrinogen oxidase
MEKVVIVGAGISGLTAAFRLKRLGISSVLLEASARPGGLIATRRRNGFLFETGPQFPRFPAPLWQLVRELDLEEEFVAGNSKANRYIFRHGSLHPAPFSPIELLQTRLVGFKSKLRVLADPLGYSHPPDHEESLAEFVERKFDREILDNLVDPVISTIFLGDARRMGMESAFPALVEWERRKGSLLRGALAARKAKQDHSHPDTSSSRTEVNRAARNDANGNANGLHVTQALPTLGSFKSGMAALPERLADELKSAMRYGVEVSSIASLNNNERAESSGWQLRLRDGETIIADHVVLAVPAHVAARLLETGAPQLASLLNAIEYAPICTVSSAYERSQVANTLDGFGFMVPRREDLHTICTFWNSALVDGRAPKGKVLITSFAGRNGDDDFANMNDESCAQAVEVENARILGIRGDALDRVVWRDARALPQFNVGHSRRIKEISDMLRSIPSLHLAGNYLSGRSIGECVDVASHLAEKLHSQLQRRHI